MVGFGRLLVLVGCWLVVGFSWLWLVWLLGLLVVGWLLVGWLLVGCWLVVCWFWLVLVLVGCWLVVGELVFFVFFGGVGVF